MIDLLTHWKLYRVFVSSSAMGFFGILLIYNRTTQWHLLYFCQRQNLRYRNFFILNVSFSTRLFVHRTFYRTLPVNRSNIRPCTASPLCVSPNFPPLPWRKKRREISRGRDYKLTLVEILKVSWGTIIPPGQLLGIETSCARRNFARGILLNLTTYLCAGWIEVPF